MKIRINKRITIFLLLVFICIISIPSALSMYREKQTKTLKTTITHPNYTLTADANGGSIPATTGWTGTGATATKQVTYDHEYGNLPTPIRNGYTFKGWNGKNLFNEMKKGVRIYPDNGEETADQDYASTNYISVDFSNGNSYYLSGLTNKLRSFIAVYDANKEFLGRTSGITRTEILLDSTSIQAFKTFDVTQAKYIRIQQYFNGTNSIDEIDNLSIQLEEGTTATTFEPYYVTSSTNVTQDKNHTLKAIWETVNYEITYDLQGGSLETENPATYNAETDTFTLNNPTQTGYTFTGWTGSNGNTPQTTVTIPTGSTGDKAYIANWTANSYTVTADANGGSIPSTTGWTGTGATSTKSVTYDSPYGTLPTPTRDGYIFKGWNGKNKFNILNIESTNSNNWDVTIDNNSVFINHKNEYTNGIPEIEFDSLLEGQYYLNGDNLDYIALYINDEYIRMVKTNQIIQINNNDKIKFTFHTPTNLVTEYSNIQLEEGSTATTYEPYYVTSQTPVTQAKNHTLTAKWKLKEATFLPGTEFNAKIKQLAANEDATYQTADTNITSILRTNALPSGFTPTDDNIVSTSDSNTPIYAWFSNGTLYYYTDAVNFYMNNSATYMFYNLNNVTSIDIADINTSKTTSMYGLFHSCYKLSMLDVSNFNTSNVTTARSIFAYNRSLTSLDVSSFDLSSVNDMTYIFTGMTELKQLKTPKTYPVDSSITISLPKLMVDSSGNEYTTLNSSSPTETWLYTPATFLPGQEFNAKIKQLAGNQDATYETADTNITSIVRSNTLSITPTSANIVSTTDSYYPIYAWYNNGVIYYYSEANNLYMNKTATRMFTNLKSVTGIDLSTISTVKSTIFYELFYNDINLETIDVSHFNTSNVTDMQRMFRNCSKIETLNLSNFNTAKVTDMRMMFSGCSSLETLNISSFRTPNVVYMNGMFTYTKLQTLDLSNFDMTKVTNTTDMLRDMTELEQFKTPNTYPSEAVIQMPQTLYDPSGNGWSVLDSSSPTETWLHKMVCKRATTLHTETCSQTSDSLYCSGAGYTVGGSKNTSTITYGSLGTNATTLNSGDAFTCDVNGDGTFNETTERFYYVGDYYNTTTKQFETDTGVLIYYNNVSAGVANNTATSAYDSSGENWHGPVTAITQLPTTSQWTNISLKNNTRAILDNSNNNTTTGGTLPSDFSYSGYSARLLTMQEINNATGETGIYKRLDVIAPYLFENTKYSIDSLNNRWWIETAISNDISCDTLYVSVNESSGYTNGIYGDSVLGLNGVRPAIEVNKNFLNKKVNAYLITYDTNGGSENTTQTVTVGDSLESLSVPTKEGYTFNGWYTATSGGEEVTTATVPTATTTYYAHWTPINYNITYDLDGGEVGTANPTTYNPDSNSITLNNPTKTGYTFLGWTGSNGNTPQTTVTIPVGSTGDKAYIANWQVNNYTFTFNANGGSVSTTTKQVTYGQTYTDLPTPTRSDYTFKGWYTDLTGTSDYINYGREYMYEDKISIHTSAYMDDWSAFNATILSSTESGGWSIASSGGKIYFGSYDKGVGYKSFNSTSTIASLSSGWHDFDLVFDGTNVKGYVDRTLVGTSATYVSGKIGYNATNSIFIGAEATSSPTTPSGGNFLGNIGNIIIKNDDTLISGTTYNTITAPAQNLTLHAIWEPVDYEITYDLQGGTLSTTNPATYNVETNTFTLNNPTLTGQTFIGWTGSNGNTPEVNVTIPVGSYGDKAYVAHFSPIYEPETRIRSLNTIGTSIADDDPDSNLRFIGSNPNNYVSFNGQKWRIIGVFDGKLKIIGDSIGNYSWDTSRNTVNNGYGVNQWGVSGTYTGADLMKLLNPGYESNEDLKCNTTVTITDGVANCGDNTDSNYTTGLVNNSLYWNASSGYCYNYGNYKTTSCDFSTSGLQSDTTRNMIDNATWYLGGNLASDNIWDGRMTASFAYNFERGNLNGKQCSSGTYCTDTVDRTTTWQGKVGLLYPSDYIYATGGGSTYNRNTCLTVHAGYVSDNSVSNWNNTYTDCKNNDWLLPSSWIWSLSPRAFSSYSNYVFHVNASAANVSNNNAMNAGSVRPVVYLKSSIKLTSGDGSYNSPFNLIDTE